MFPDDSGYKFLALRSSLACGLTVISELEGLATALVGPDSPFWPEWPAVPGPELEPGGRCPRICPGFGWP